MNPEELKAGRRLLADLRLCQSMNDAYGTDAAYTRLSQWMMERADALLTPRVPSDGFDMNSAPEDLAPADDTIREGDRHYAKDFLA